MMKKLIFLVASLVVGTLLIAPQIRAAPLDPDGDPDRSSQTTTQSSDANDPLFGACTEATKDSPVCKSKDVEENPAIRIIRATSNIIALVAGIGAVIMLIIGGLTLITGGGNSEKVANAKRRIIYAIVGLLVVAFAWVITRFITDRVIQ